MDFYKNKIKKAAVVYRRATPAAHKAAESIVGWLGEHKIQAFSHPTQKLPGTKRLQDPKNLDLVIALGGDGTYLEAVRMLHGERVPLLGFNLGGLGFLTVNRATEINSMLELAIAGKLELRKRSMIRIEVRSKNKLKGEFVALNDLVIERGSRSRLISITITIDNLPIHAIKADGLIVGTPTGSTAYNLAAGGPILHPEVDALVVTPICPHSLTSRPFIFSDKGTIQFNIDESAMMTVDGVKAVMVGRQDEIRVSRDKCDHLFLRRPGSNYFSVLKEKLKFGERA
jgi:NAD+ kinase